MPRGRGVGVAKSLEIGHPSKNWNARFGQELLVFYKKDIVLKLEESSDTKLKQKKKRLRNELSFSR